MYDNGIMNALGTTYAQAYGINNTGQVVGFSYTSSGNIYAFLYTDGIMNDLGTLPGGPKSWAYGINNSGQIVGCAQTSSGDHHAVLWNPINPIPEPSTWLLLRKFRYIFQYFP